jgi:hypothetical protein
MWFEDLTKCDYFGEEYAEILTAVGWLENEKPFATGKVPIDFFEKLSELQKNPWTFAFFCGFHECSICQFKGKSGIKNIFIPHNKKIYVCPELITHYINNHFYLPPDEFIEAVLNCPPQKSMEYLKKMLENGGRDLVKTLKEK